MRKDGTRFWASVVIDAIHDDDGKLIGFAKITRDMTEKRETQLRLEEAREQLFRSQKMEALGQLTGGLAHDFNNLLTAILGAAELGLRNLDNPDKIKRMLDGVRGSAQRGAEPDQAAARLRPRPAARDQADRPQGLLHRRDDAGPPLAPQQHRGGDRDFRPVLAGRRRSRRARARVLNLAFNARDAMKDGGKLKISAHNEVLRRQARGLRASMSRFVFRTPARAWRPR